MQSESITEVKKELDKKKEEKEEQGTTPPHYEIHPDLECPEWF